MDATIKMGNDEFILYIRKQNPNADRISTKDLGRKIWEWIREHEATAEQYMKDAPCLWDTNINAHNIASDKLPKTATQFIFRRSLLPELYEYLSTIQ